MLARGCALVVYVAVVAAVGGVQALCCLCRPSSTASTPRSLSKPRTCAFCSFCVAIVLPPLAHIGCLLGVCAASLSARARTTPSSTSLSTPLCVMRCCASTFSLTVGCSRQIAMFSEYCKVPFSVERVEVVDEATGKTEVACRNRAAWTALLTPCAFSRRAAVPSAEGGGL